jgi:alcohol dehydrogenase class IV
MHWDQIIKVILENREVVGAFLVSLIAIIKLTAWGKAQAMALDTVIGVIEEIGAGQVKSGVAASDLTGAAKDAVADSVAKADPKQTPQSLVVRILREVFRGI